MTRNTTSNHYRTGEFHKFLRLRKYVKIMQAGSQLLLHHAGTLRAQSSEFATGAPFLKSSTDVRMLARNVTALNGPVSILCQLDL